MVATANDLSALPPELLRKGRFDEIFFVDLPDAAEREAILRIHLGCAARTRPRFDMRCAAAASEGFSGAEIEQAVIAALLGALQGRRPLDTELLAASWGPRCRCRCSRREDVDRLRALARERFVPVR